MNWLIILIKLIGALPQIIKIINEIIKLINGIKDKAERKMARRELNKAIEEAKRTKSAKPVEAIYKKLKQRVN